jgi:RNA polymerase sigma-70 factor (ECF subfamily)
LAWDEVWPDFPQPRRLGYGAGMSEALDRWFVEQVLVHEAALLRYLQRHLPGREDARDLCQEAYARVYEAAARQRPAQPRAFLFTCARHLLTDRLRRARVVSIEPLGDLDPSFVLIDECAPDRWCGGRQALQRLARAFDRLPGRCREVVWLRRVEQLSQKDVAERLGISEKTVENHIARGMRLLADALFGGDGAADAAVAEARPGAEPVHGRSFD